MKLLNPLEFLKGKDAIKENQDRQNLLLSQQIAAKSIELSKLEVEFNQTLLRQQAIWEQQKSEKEGQLQSLSTQVSHLEARRAELEKPLDDKWKELEKAEQIVIERDKESLAKQQEVNELSESLQERLTDLSDREAEFDERAIKQVLQQQGLEQQKDNVSNQAQMINQALVKAQEELAQRQNELMNKEANLNARDIVIGERVKMLDARELELAGKERQLIDREQVLERNIARTKKPVKKAK